MQLVLIQPDFINQYYLAEDIIVDLATLFFLSLKIGLSKKIDTVN